MDKLEELRDDFFAKHTGAVKGFMGAAVISDASVVFDWFASKLPKQQVSDEEIEKRAKEYSLRHAPEIAEASTREERACQWMRSRLQPASDHKADLVDDKFDIQVFLKWCYEKDRDGNPVIFDEENNPYELFLKQKTK